MELFLDIFGHHLAVEQVDNAVGKPGIIGRVGYHDNCRSGIIQAGEQFHHLFAIHRIEVTSRFIGQNQLGVGYYGPGNGYPLLLTTG